MKKVLLILLVVLVGSSITTAVRIGLDIKVSSEVLGKFGGIVYSALYMIWGSIIYIFMGRIFYPRKTEICVKYVLMSQNSALN